MADAPESGSIPGIDVSGVERWMSQLPIAAEPPITFEVAGQGKSNIVVIASGADGRRWVLRRPPLGSLLATAHDVAREYRILRGLSGTEVPVPEAIALTTDGTVATAPLMLMSHVDGLVVDDLPAAESCSPELRQRISRGLVEALAAVHSVDLQQTGLADLASHRPFAARQLKRWRAQWEDSRTRDEPRVDALAERLSAAMPDQEQLGLVHGDYHLRNAIFDPANGRVRALIDWELATLGDPLSDLGLLLAYWPEAGDPPGQPFPASALPGFATRGELVEFYGESTGRDVASVAFWEVLGLWKVAVILEGVRRRALDDPRNADRGATIDQVTIDAMIDRAWARAAAVGI